MTVPRRTREHDARGRPDHRDPSVVGDLVRVRYREARGEPG